MDQAIANGRIEGFEPDAEFLADSDSLVEGNISADELRAKIIARARQMDAVAKLASSNGSGQADGS